MTIKEFILARTLAPQPTSAPDTTETLLGSAKNAARLREAIAAPTAPELVFQSVDDVRHALGI